MLFFSHGCAIREAGKYLEIAANNLKACQNIALDGLKAGESKEDIASSILDFLAGGSESARMELSFLSNFTINGVDAFNYFFKRKNMI